jgi:hypothetical protein
MHFFAFLSGPHVQELIEAMVPAFGSGKEKARFQNAHGGTWWDGVKVLDLQLCHLGQAVKDGA